MTMNGPADDLIDALEEELRTTVIATFVCPACGDTRDETGHSRTDGGKHIRVTGLCVECRTNPDNHQGDNK